MYDFHPFITSFPIVLIFLAVFAEIIFKYSGKSFWEQFNLVTLYLGLAFTTLAFITGLIAGANIPEITPEVEKLIAHHYSYARLILFLYLPLILFRHLRKDKKVLEILYVTFLILQFLVIFYTSHIGGEMVMQHGVGVQNNKF